MVIAIAMLIDHYYRMKRFYFECYCTDSLEGTYVVVVVAGVVVVANFMMPS